MSGDGVVLVPLRVSSGDVRKDLGLDHGDCYPALCMYFMPPTGILINIEMINIVHILP